MKYPMVVLIVSASATCCSNPNAGVVARAAAHAKIANGDGIVIPLRVWLPPRSSWLADHYRREYERVLRGELPNAPATAILHRGVGALDSLFATVDDPSLDGARAEGYAHDLVFALTVLGDERFAEALADQPVARRRQLASQIMFGIGSLLGKVPATERVCDRARL